MGGGGRTWIVHVSSELKSTMGSPPLAISILFCGRNRATTALSYGQHVFFWASALRRAAHL
jgi:hypothetical protein